jgi:hypothetical protein
MAFAETENNLDLSVAAEAGYIDNFLYQTRKEQNTTFYKLSSNVAFASKSKQSAFDFDAKLDSYLFDEFKDDDHTDFSLNPEYQYKFSHNQRFYLSGHWLNSYTYRGTSLSLGEAESLIKGDKRQDIGGRLGFEYGNEDSQGRLNFEVSYSEGEFTTRRDVTNGLDNETLNVKSSFDYLLSGKTYLAFDVGYQMNDYANATALNRDSTTGLVGIKWQTTVISELSLLLGYQDLQFENSPLADDNAFKWRFDYTWRPSNFSTLHIASNRKFDETNRLNNSYRLAEIYQIDISHAFTDNISTFVAISFNNEDLITQGSRSKENYIHSSLEVKYRRSERFNFYLRYDYKSLDANYADIDYLYNNISLGVQVQL